jgi:hypothetical protein
VRPRQAAKEEAKAQIAAVKEEAKAQIAAEMT